MKKEILVGDDIVISTKVLTSLEEHQIPYKLGFKEGGYRIDKNPYTGEDWIVEHDYFTIKVKEKYYEQAKVVISHFVSEEEAEQKRLQDIENGNVSTYLPMILYSMVFLHKYNSILKLNQPVLLP